MAEPTHFAAARANPIGTSGSTGNGSAAWLPVPDPLHIRRGPSRPVVIACANGNTYKTAVRAIAFTAPFLRMVQGDVPSAPIAGVTERRAVGMKDVISRREWCVRRFVHARPRRRSAVAALEGVLTPSLVARAVADQTDHHLAGVQGEGLRAPARHDRGRLNTETSRRLWLDRKRCIDPEHYLTPPTLSRRSGGRGMLAAGFISREHYYGTINR